MSNVFVVNSQTVQVLEKSPRLAWDNHASTMTVASDRNTANLPTLTDGLTTKRWSLTATTGYVEFTGSSINTDYVAIAGSNWQTAGCSITLIVNAVTVASFSGLRDNQPIFYTMPLGSNVVRLEFSCTNDQLEIGEIYIGKSIELPKNVSVGYSPGRWNSKDIISTSNTQANQHGRSTVEKRGSTESFTLNYVDISYMENEFKTFQDLAKGRPVFFVWDKNNSTQAMYGHWSVSRMSFDHSFYSTINMEIKGSA